MTPQQISQEIGQRGAGTRTALVFGREHSGLSNEELMLCNYMVTIPTNPEFSSLNVASAIQVMCYEIFQSLSARNLMPGKDPESTEAIATAHDMEGYFAHLEQVIKTTGFLDEKSPGLLMKRLRKIYQRVELSHTEVNILRGILSSVEKYKNKEIDGQ